jgi:ornithine cyclodeaminase/alanine dehydrogenase-like protein (mu-crystallin family)
MYYVAEQTVMDLVAQAPVTDAIKKMYIQMARGVARNFPVVREQLGYADAIFGFKSGFDKSGPSLGVKAGGLWPGNRAKGLANHQSTVVLFDCETGSPHALVRGTFLTALRTAAASAISIELLARQDAKSLGILGAGGQSLYQLEAALPLRKFTTLYIADQFKEQAERLATNFAGRGLKIEITDAQTMASHSDVIITVTPAFKPAIAAEWIRPGTHLACMGADTKGKQEVATELVQRAHLFVDELQQAISIGECQHAFAAGRIKESDLTIIGAVLDGTQPGRRNAEEITLFDSTGVGLQDIVAGRLALELALKAGRAVELP